MKKTLSTLPQLCVCRSGFVEAQYIDDGKDGCLNILTISNELPFKVMRVYYIRGFAGADAIRGKHAHKKLDQALFCVSGSFTLLLDDGVREQYVPLVAGPIGVRIGPALWHTMQDFSIDCVILVLASAPYDENDYIRDYNEFKRYTRDYPVH